MTTGRWVAARVGRWVLVVALAVAAFAWTAGVVEGASSGLVASAWSAALGVPVVVVELASVIIAVGAGLAAARTLALGERTALEACGHGPWRTGRAALVVGMCAGGVQLLLAHAVVPRANEAALRLRDGDGAAWVWLDGQVVRPADGMRVALSHGRITQVDVMPPAALAQDDLRRARQLQSPRTATRQVLLGATTPPARAELSTRRARVAAGALLAYFCWLPLGPTAGRQVGAALLVGLSYGALELSVRALASQGQLSAALGPWLPPTLALAAVMVAALISQGRGTTRR